ncbi:MAG: coproporphyrinogen dehydrogenase HemZ [Vallitalea sp.]|jgi:oxygen-independent coproporphyrinogen-3 oxidase|nr:coproporphyrinogen dehydrogenase HemZ [Vallitalea sp.]
MKLILKGHEYEIKMLLNLFFDNMQYEIVDKVCDIGISIKSIISDELYEVSYYEDGILKTVASFDKSIIDKMPYDSLEQRKISKRLLKNLTYKVAAEITNKNLPWGILTGIRPTKIVHDLIKKYGKNYEIIRKILREEYLISDEKIHLMLEIAESEIKILETNKNNEINIYIGIPFCPTKCLYCSFTSYPINKWMSHVVQYLEALEQEMRYVSESLTSKKVKSIYVGGGTPTSVNAEQLEMLMKMINKYFDVKSIEEFTVEAGRPDTINANKLNILKKYGVTRISINPQTMNNKTLDIIGRRHTVDDIFYAFSLARKAGFNNINMDLILGLPGETYDDVKETMNQIRKLNPESITVHTMAIKRASRLKETIDKYDLTKDITIREMIDMVYKEAKSMNLNPYYMYRQKNMVGNYENVGYCVKGLECIYNVEIIEEAQSIIALGAGSVSKIVYKEENRIERIENVKNVEQYISRVNDMIERKRKFFQNPENNIYK